MRIRATKPEFWRSAKVASVNWEARLVLKGLESYVDDNGVGKDDIELITSDLFSRDLARESSGTLKRVTEAVTSLSRAGFLHRYEVDGTRLMYLSWWDSTQYINKPTRGRFPRPDGTFNYKDSEIGSPLQNPPEDSSNPPVGTEEQGIRGTGDQSSSSNKSDGKEIAEAFDAFWAIYPRREGKGQARTAFKSALKKTDLPTILHAVNEYAAWLRREGKERTYIAMPASWLNGERWSDERAPSEVAPKVDPNWALR